MSVSSLPRSFVYDRQAQKQMSNYNKMLVEMAFMDEENWSYSPSSSCIISTGGASSEPPRFQWDISTDDRRALIDLIGLLETAKAAAVNRLLEMEG